MARVEYQHRLQALEADLQEQGAVVLRAVRGAIHALETQDVELCDEVIAFDDYVPPSDLATMTQGVAHAFEARIAEHPADWHMLQKLWLEDLDPR